MIKTLLEELRTWNWPAWAALLFCWAIVFIPFIK